MIVDFSDPSDGKKKKSSVTGVDLPDLVIPPTEAAEASTRPTETEGKDGQSAGFGGKSRFAGLFGSSEARQPPQVTPKVASSSPPTPSSDIHLPSPNQPVLPMALASILAATPAQVSPAEQQAGRTLLSFIRKDDVTPPGNLKVQKIRSVLFGGIIYVVYSKYSRYGILCPADPGCYFSSRIKMFVQRC